MRTFFMILIVLVGLFGASVSTVSAQKKAKPGKDFLLQMERSPCRGACPAYIVTVDAKGNVVYEGKRSVKNIGQYTKTISAAKVKEIAGLMKTSDYFSFDEKYDNEGIADAVVWTINYTNRGKSKQVIDRYGAPESLKDLQEKLESIIGEDGYQKAD